MAAPFSLSCIIANLKMENNGTFKAGHPGGPGRPPGLQNQLTRTVKETVLKVFNELQEDADVNLTAFATKYPRDFYQIAARLIPTDIKADIRFSKVLLEIERTTNGEKEDQVTDITPQPANGTE